MTIGIIVGIVIVACCIGAIVLAMTLSDEKPVLSGIAGIVAAALVVSFFVVPFSFHTVSSGEIAVVKQLGKITGTKTAGTHYDTWFTHSYSNYNMLCVDEAGIYQALSRSTRLEARKFIDWISGSLVNLRKAVGLEGYEALKLTDTSVQKLIADKIDISYKEPTGDLIPVKAEPTVVNNYINDVDYRKVFTYAAAGCVCVAVVYCGVNYVVKRVKSKKAEKKGMEV